MFKTFMISAVAFTAIEANKLTVQNLMEHNELAQSEVDFPIFDKIKGAVESRKDKLVNKGRYVRDIIRETTNQKIDNAKDDFDEKSDESEVQGER